MATVLQLADFAIPSVHSRTTTSASTGEPRGAGCIGVVVGTLTVFLKISCRGLGGLASAVQRWLQRVR